MAFKHSVTIDGTEFKWESKTHRYTHVIVTRWSLEANLRDIELSTGQFRREAVLLKRDARSPRDLYYGMSTQQIVDNMKARSRDEAKAHAVRLGREVGSRIVFSWHHSLDLALKAQSALRGRHCGFASIEVQPVDRVEEK